MIKLTLFRNRFAHQLLSVLFGAKLAFTHASATLHIFRLNCNKALCSPRTCLTKTCKGNYFEIFRQNSTLNSYQYHLSSDGTFHCWTVNDSRKYTFHQCIFLIHPTKVYIARFLCNPRCILLLQCSQHNHDITHKIHMHKCLPSFKQLPLAYWNPFLHLQYWSSGRHREFSTTQSLVAVQVAL